MRASSFSARIRGWSAVIIALMLTTSLWWSLSAITNARVPLARSEVNLQLDAKATSPFLREARLDSFRPRDGSMLVVLHKGITCVRCVSLLDCWPHARSHSRL